MINNKETQDIYNILKLFKELDVAEIRQTNKIFAIIELLQMQNKDRDFKELDKLIDETMELKKIVAEKYLKIGIAYIQSKEGV